MIGLKLVCIIMLSLKQRLDSEKAWVLLTMCSFYMVLSHTWFNHFAPSLVLLRHLTIS